MTFKYYSTPLDHRSFWVQVNARHDVTEVAWKKPVLSSDVWIEQQVQLNLTRLSYTQVAFVTETPILFLSQVRFQSGSCESSDVCSFDDASTCQWLDRSPDPEFTFKTTNHLENRKGMFPNHDARQNSHSGRFLTLNSPKSDGKFRPHHALLVGPEIPFAKYNTFCLKFQQWKVQPYGQQLSLHVVSSTNDSILSTNWRMNKYPFDSNDEWHLIQAEISRPKAGKLALSISHSFNDTGVLAIDDLELKPGHCYRPIECPFDVSFCGFYATHHQSLPFTIGSGRLADSQSMARKLSESFVQKYLYADFTNENPSTGSRFSNEFSIRSQWQLKSNYATQRKCIKFDFFVAVEPGSEDQSTAVRLKIIVETERNSYELFHFEGQSSDQWQNAQLILHEQNSFRIRIVAERVFGHGRAVVAMSNLDSPPSGCSKKESDSSQAEGKEIEALSCDYSTDMCGWRALTADDWILRKKHETSDGKSDL
jgi:hypothetical protein